ncbi:MAG TPA: ferritin-like domain-containing protein [Oceanithermus sp.]|nr:ferritin-like domain-containing protein [Oceanithermus sp.]
MAGVLERVPEGRRKLLLEVLKTRYQDELADAQVVERAAEGLPYAELRAVLRKIASRERRHAELLAERIKALGGTPPPPPEVKEGATWEELLRALESEKADRVAYLEEAFGLGDPETKKLFARIKEEEEANYKELLEVLAKLDPYAEGA